MGKSFTPSLFDGPPPDDDPPAQWHSRTSTQAADAIKPDASRLRSLVLVAIRERDGLTDEEGTDATGLPPSTYRPRRVELVQSGLIRDSGRTRPTRSGRKAVVWVAAGQ